MSPTARIVGRLKVGALGLVLLLVFAACGASATPAPVVVEREVIKEVPKEVVVEKEVVKEVLKEVVVTPTPAPKDPVVFADLNWDSAQQQNAIARIIVEDGYGYPTDAIFGGTVPLWTGLLNEDIHVFMEMWLPNNQEIWEKSLAEGAVIPVGKSLDDNWQSAFVVPSYVIEGDPARGIEPLAPDLKTPQDLVKYQELFSTPESRGKARLVNCLSAWGCSAVNEASVKAYGLEEVIHLQDPGSDIALFASLEGAYEKGDPWLGYLWGPTKTAAELDLTLLEEPDCAPGAGPETGCAYPTSLVRIAVHPSLITRAPQLVEFLRLWDYSASIQVAIDGYRADSEATPEEAAIWFLKNNDIWRQWVPEDVADNVSIAVSQR